MVLELVQEVRKIVVSLGNTCEAYFRNTFLISEVRGFCQFWSVKRFANCIVPVPGTYSIYSVEHFLTKETLKITLISLKNDISM